MLGEKSALKILRQMTSDTDAGVRIQVAESMWRLGDEAAREVLEAGTGSQFADDRKLCLLALAAPRDRRVSENLRGKLTDDYTEVALVAARAMGDIGFDDGYGVAMNSVRSTDPRQRLLAAMALGAIGRSDAQTTLATMLKDTDPRVRLGCATALLKLQERGEDLFRIECGVLIVEGAGDRSRRQQSTIQNRFSASLRLGGEI